MSLTVLTAAAIALLSGPAQGYETTETVISNMRQAAQLSGQWTVYWLAEPDKNCASPTVRRSESITSEIIRVAVSNAAVLNDNTMGSTSKWRASTIVEGVAPIAAQSRLDLGNAYLRGGCLDDADRIFREVMTTFTGPQYQSLARVGIDDVREARRTAPSPDQTSVRPPAPALPAPPITIFVPKSGQNTVPPVCRPMPWREC